MLMLTSSTHRVAVFWDFENCRLSYGTSGNTVVDRLRCLLQKFGSIMSFRAYVDLSSECSSPKSIALQSELQSSGVTLIHCPHNGLKDVADKMMIVDMLVFAMDNPSSATIAIVTGDRDFAYAAAILRLRGFRIIVVAPPRVAHASLKAQADHLYNWQKDILSPNGSDLTPPKADTLPNAATKTNDTTPSFTPSDLCNPHVAPDESLRAPSDQMSSPGSDLCKYDLGCPSEQLDCSLSKDSPETSPSFQEPFTYEDEETVEIRLCDTLSDARDAEQFLLTSPEAVIAEGSEMSVIEMGSSFPGSDIDGQEDLETWSLSKVDDAFSPGERSSHISNHHWPMSTILDRPRTPQVSGSKSCSNPVQQHMQADRIETENRTSFLQNVPQTVEQADISSCLSGEAVGHHSSPPFLPMDMSSLAPDPIAVAPVNSTEPTIKSNAEDTVPLNASSTSASSSDETNPLPTDEAKCRFSLLIDFFIEQKALNGETRISSEVVTQKVWVRNREVFKSKGLLRFKLLIEEAMKARVVASIGPVNKSGGFWVEINPKLYLADEATQALKASSTSASSSKGTYGLPIDDARRRFSLLIKFFTEQKALKGETRISSEIVFQKVWAGEVSQTWEFSCFNQFIEEAMKASVVASMGPVNKNGQFWVEINPKLYPMDEVAQALESPSTSTSSSSSSSSTSKGTYGLPIDDARRRFSLLIDFFIEHRASKGDTRVSSKDIYLSLWVNMDKAFQSGFSNFKQFIEKARSVSVIVISGLNENGFPWVQLNSNLYPLEGGSKVKETTFISKAEVKSSPGINATPPCEPVYLPLIHVLRKELPDHCADFSALGTLLKVHTPGLYKRAQVSTLSAYLKKAEKQGIVLLGSGSTAGTEWAKLMPAYRNSVL